MDVLLLRLDAPLMSFGAVVVFISAIAYMVLPSMVAAITGSGCIG